MIRENVYQAKVIRKLRELFPGCLVIKNDSSLQQGLPDLLILWGSYWAALEIKTSAEAMLQPNQEYYIKQLDEMSFAAYIYPENEREVLSALQQAFEPPRRARISES
jgi:hypothetical protein